MKYEGRFKTIKEETIQVIIITNNDSSSVTELKLAGDSPIVITQKSSNGVFTPIKSRGCTISLVTDAPYLDMYSQANQGVSLRVNNLSQGICLFYGFVTPCEYSQEFVGLDTIEIEAVDAISSLENIPYTPLDNTRKVQPTMSIINYLIKEVAGYNGNFIYSNDTVFQRYDYDTQTTEEIPILCGAIDENNFFDDDDEETPWTCYEVLEEIARYVGMTFVPFGEDVYLIDYDGVVNNRPMTDENNISHPISLQTINKDSYASNSHTLSIEETYNKITVSENIYDVGDEDKATFKNLFEDEESNLSNIQNDWHLLTYSKMYTGDDWTKTLFHKNYILVKDKQPSNIQGIGNYWKQHFWKYNNSITPTEIIAPDSIYFVPPIDEVNNRMCGIGAFPTKCASWDNKSAIIPNELGWSDYIAFYTSAYQFYYNTRNGHPIPINYNKLIDYGNITKYWNYELSETYAEPLVLEYNSPNEVNYNPSIDEPIYFCFDAKLLYHSNIGDDADTWGMVEDKISYNEFPSDLGSSQESVIDVNSEQITHTFMNGEIIDGLSYTSADGYPLLKLKVQIGDNYWNGSTWTTTPSTFTVKYRYSSNRNEGRISYGVWMEPVYNTDFTIDLGGNYIAMKIDKPLSGQVHIEIYQPRQWASNDGNPMIWIMDSSYTKAGITNYAYMCPIIWMKDLTFKIASNTVDSYYLWDSSNESIVESEDDDILFTNDVVSNDVRELDEIECKINTYNSKKPIAKSYYLIPLDGNYVYSTNNVLNKNTDTIINCQEQNILDKNLRHYSNPKKIYNTDVHSYYNPISKVSVTAIPNSFFIVDEQEFNVKTDTNELKLIEY